MKTLKKIYLAAAVLAAVCLWTLPVQAQNSYYANIDWQFNNTMGTGFADKFNGWGGNFEGGAYLGGSNFAIGGFLNFQTNNEYISMRTLPIGTNGSVTTDQQHSIFQLPFGVTGRYSFNDRTGIFAPYLALKLGANYSEMTSYYSAFESYDDTWGFYVSPEIGTVIYPAATRNFGFHLAVYYGYATNKASTFYYSVKGINNVGLRVGISF